MDQWIFWAATTVITAMMGALCYLIKRMIGGVDRKLEDLAASIDDRQARLEARMAAQEERHNQMIKDLPKVYAYREDLLRISAETNGRLDRIQDLLIDMLRRMGYGNKDQ